MGKSREVSVSSVTYVWFSISGAVNTKGEYEEK